MNGWGAGFLFSDEMLATRALKGELSAFEELVNRYKSSVFSIIYRMLGQYQEAEDVSQEVFNCIQNYINLTLVRVWPMT